MTKEAQVYLPVCKYHSTGPGQASKMERRPVHDHINLPTSDLVPRDYTSGDKATKGIFHHLNGFYRMQKTVEAIPKVMENIQLIPGG